jgi:hypothetical protein
MTRQQGQRQSGQDRQDRKIKTSTCKILDKMKEICPQLQVLFNWEPIFKAIYSIYCPTFKIIFGGPEGF